MSAIIFFVKIRKKLEKYEGKRMEQNKRHNKKESCQSKIDLNWQLDLYLFCVYKLLTTLGFKKTRSFFIFQTILRLVEESQCLLFEMRLLHYLRAMMMLYRDLLYIHCIQVTLISKLCKFRH